jgi:hypothetical protein
VAALVLRSANTLTNEIDGFVRQARGKPAGYNMRWLLRAIVRLGLKGLFAPLQSLLAWLQLALATSLRREKLGVRAWWYGAPLSGFHARGRVDRLMMG